MNEKNSLHITVHSNGYDTCSRICYQKKSVPDCMTDTPENQCLFPGTSLYTVFQKKLYPFYFCNNFVDSGPIWIIFGRNVENEDYSLLTLTYLLLYLTTGNQLKCC